MSPEFDEQRHRRDGRGRFAPTAAPADPGQLARLAHQAGRAVAPADCTAEPEGPLGPDGATLCGVCGESIVDGEDVFGWTAEDGHVHDGCDPRSDG